MPNCIHCGKPHNFKFLKACAECFESPSRPCSRCGGPNRRQGQRYCHVCHADYMRENRRQKRLIIETMPLVHQRRAAGFRGPDKTACGLDVVGPVMAVKYPSPGEITCHKCIRAVLGEDVELCPSCGRPLPRPLPESTDSEPT